MKAGRARASRARAFVLRCRTVTQGPELRDRLGRLTARVGLFASVLIVFASGWFAMRTDDWRKIVALTALAAVAGVVASQFSRRLR